MNPEAERLYHLLPALYRIRDAQEGEPLKALCEVIAEDIAALRENLDQLYEDQFIETCADWVAPYLGQLVGYRTLHGVTERTRSARAEVANTIAYRRRKGTATVLEQLARDVTGWHARAVEFFQQLQTSQYMNHLRPENRVTVELRDWEALERRGTAFNTIPHSVDVRRIETQRGRYNIPNVGLFLWRLEAFSVTDSRAFPVGTGRFLFSPLGHAVQLVTRPESETDIAHLAEPINVPEPISRRVLDRDLDQHRDETSSLYYGRGRSLSIDVDGRMVKIGELHVCNLSDDGESWAHLPREGETIAIDPVLGRIAFPPDKPSDDVRVTYHQGFSMAMGGGEYERRASFALNDNAARVTQGLGLQEAVEAAAGGGIVEIGDSDRYAAELTIRVEAGRQMEVRAANERRPVVVLHQDMEIRLQSGAQLTLNGLLITGGRLRVRATPGTGENPPVLRLRHCTLVPGLALKQGGDQGSPQEPSLIVESSADVTLDVEYCILGGVRCPRGVMASIRNSIVDATAEEEIAFAAEDNHLPGGVLTLVNATVIGRVHSARLELVSNSIIMASTTHPKLPPVMSDQNQQGCVRFSFLPADSIAPSRYRCQPDLAVEAALLAADQPPGSLDPVRQQAITLATEARVKPVFTSLRYGQPGYGQLALSCPAEIRMGADDASEMGAFHDLFAPQRESNLRIRLQEYLRFGLKAGIFYAS